MMETADAAATSASEPAPLAIERSPSTPAEDVTTEAAQPLPAGSDAAAEEEETRVITLDTIIRKGLVEQMPMTAKDVVNIVSKSMQKERERQAADRLRLAASAPPTSGSGASAAVPTTSSAAAANQQRVVGQAAASAGDSSSDNSDSCDDEYDSHNDDDDDADEDVVDAAAVTAADNAEQLLPVQQSTIKQPPTISVIQRAPPPPSQQQQQQPPVCNEMQLADDLRASNAVPSIAGSSDDQLEEECDLRSGDLHYSESNTSDNSDAEHRRLSRSSTEQHQPAADETPRMSSRRRRTPLVTATAAVTRQKTPARTTTTARSSADLSLVHGGRSCTDSKRNAILMQCSAAASAVLATKPRRSQTPPPPQEEEDEAAEAVANTTTNDPEVVDMNLESMLQVQHSMDDVDMVDAGHHNTTGSSNTERGDQTPSGSPIMIKVERMTPPIEDLLVVHHVQTSLTAENEPAPSAEVPVKKRRARGAGKATRQAVPKAATVKKPQTTRKKKSTPPTEVALLTPMPTIQAVYSVADAPDTAAGSAAVAVATAAAAEAAAAAKHREKRQSAAKSTPVYAELSDNSNEPPSDGIRKPQRPKATAKPSSGSDATTPQRIHWKTQLKLQRQQTENAAAAAAAEAAAAAAVATTVADEEQSVRSPERAPEEDVAVVAAHTASVADEVTVAPIDEPLPEGGDHVVDDDDGSGSAPESLASTVHSNIINKIIEPPHNQKRIPKLKYGSFNFTERRGMLAKGPKMVLKYKKKYKLKTKSAHAAASGAADEVDDATTSVTAADVKPELLKATSSADGPMEKGAETMVKKSHVVKKRKSTKPPSSATSSSTTTTTTSSSEPPHKLSKSTKLLMPTDGAATAADTTRSLRERNKVLLEILEHRIYEIRHLKLRLAHMQHSTHALHSPPITDNNGSAPVFPLSAGTTALPPLRPKLEPGLDASLFDPTSATLTTTDATPDWSADELAQAHSLHSLQPLLYAHLQQCYSLPLPLATECVAWSAAVRIECGHLLADIVRIMQAQGAHMSALQRVTVLHITELPVRPAFEYAEHNDRLQHVRARRLHVVWARGLHADWQQPLFLTTGGLPELVPAIRAAIVRLHAIQYNVIACCAPFGDATSAEATDDGRTTAVAAVSKTGAEPAAPSATDSDRVNNNNNSSNGASSCGVGDGCDAAALWQQLGVSRGYSYFSHPATNEPVYTFYFGGNLLEAVQRTLLKRGGFCTVDTPPVQIVRAPLDALRAVAPGWYATAVADARQLFAARTSELLRAVRPAQYAVCADFVDVFGAYATLMFEAEYGGERLETQMQTLSHVQLQLYKLQRTEPAVGVLKAAIAHTIESLKLLQHTMRQKYGVDAFPARAVSEDCLRQRWWAASTGADAVARSLRDTLDRLRRMAVHGASARESLAASNGVAAVAEVRIDVSRPERHYVQRLIDGMVQPYATLAERQKFVADLWRMEERFQALWTPFFVGGAGATSHDAASATASVLTVDHVLRDTLGKLKPAASLECAVRYMQQRIALRVAVVNELGGVERWPSYVLRTSAAAVAAARQSID